MSSKFIIEAVGYLGSFLVVVSMLMNSVKKLRIVNTVGSVIFATYAVIIQSYPTAIMNAFLVGINIYNLIKLSKEAKNYNVIKCYKDESIVQLYLESNLADIQKFFPEFELGGGHLSTLLVCAQANPVGIAIGKMEDTGRFNVELDYTVPTYRDCSVGKFLYNYIDNEMGIKEIVFDKKSCNHEEYLLNMGFEKEGESFIRRKQID